MSDWRVVHVRLEDDSLKISGIEIWRQDWRRTADTAVQLPHPSYPHQRHRFDIVEVGSLNHPVRFAARELSNGVWGFYIPV